MFGIGAQELIIILVVALVVFGPKRLPELARSLGRGLAEFRRASNDLRQTLNQEPPPPTPASEETPGPPSLTAGSAPEEGAGAEDATPPESDLKSPEKPSGSRGG